MVQRNGISYHHHQQLANNECIKSLKKCNFGILITFVIQANVIHVSTTLAMTVLDKWNKCNVLIQNVLPVICKRREYM